jgi:sucrose-6-phosphate hydrolase SacC (GH32 family)
MWAWVTSAGPDNKLLNKTIQSLPRELSLPADRVLRIKPLRELEGQRVEPITLSDVKLESPITGHDDRVPPTAAPSLQRIAELPGDAVEIRINIAREEAARKLFGLVLFSAGKSDGLPIMLCPETGTLRVGGTEAPFAVADLPAGEDVELRIFLDKYLVEVFANGRQAVLAAHLDHGDKHGLDAFTVGASTTLKKVEIWKLKPTNQGLFEAQKSRIWEPQTK